MLTKQQWQDAYAKLRPYQTEAVQFMIRYKRTLEFDDMGLGKTVVTIMSNLHEAIDKEDFTLCVCCTTNALYVWKEEFMKWLGLDVILYVGTPAQRKKIQIPNKGIRIIVTTYGMLKEMALYHWDGIVADEIHMAGLLNHKTQTFKNFSQIAKVSSLVSLLTGTPIRQGVIDMFAPLNIVAFSIFSNYWGFVNKHCITTMTPFGKNIERNPRDVVGFRQILGRYMIRRLKSEVLKDLPGKQRNPIPLKMTPIQARAHQEIMNSLYYADDDSLVVTPNKMTAMLRARQLLVSPRLLGIDDDGAALEYLMEVADTYKITNKPFVIATPFKQAIPIIADAIKQIISDVRVYPIQGGMTPAAFANSWQTFLNDKYPHKVMIAVIKSGASFHATCADNIYFMGYEWDFNLNAQMEDRLCRLGQKNFVNCNYLLHEGTVDEDVKERLNDKNFASDLIVGTQQQFNLIMSRIKRTYTK